MISASPRPITVISVPPRQGLKPVTTVLAAPIRKWAKVLIANDEMIAGYPLVKKNGKMGIKAPAAVESVADNADVQGFGKDCSERPSSSLPKVLRADSG